MTITSSPVTRLRDGVDTLHNQPPEAVEIDAVNIDPKVLKARLDRQYKPMMDRFVELGLGFKKLPAKITTAEEAKRVVDWVAKQCRPLALEAKTAHEAEKKPFLEPGRVVDRFFNDPLKQLDLNIAAASRRAGDFQKQEAAAQRQREEAARRAAAQEQQRAAAEAARLAEEARQKEAAGDRPAAIELTAQAEEQQTRVAVAAAIIAAPAAPVRLHGEYGATGFSVTNWTFRVTNPAEIPLGYLKPDKEAIQQAINEGARDIAGLEIYEVDRFQIRRC